MKVDNPPRIVGLLDDAVWQKIEPITDFRQWEPNVGEPVSERTEVRICYDSHFLYVGVRGYDREPSKISARNFARDSMAIDDDDSFTIGIDSLNDNRTAYAFDTNVNGAQLDVQMIEGGEMNIDWDGIWYSKGNIDADGFTLEFAIPFFTLRFKSGEEAEMGIILERIIQRRAEKSYWPALTRDHNFGNISHWGRLVGLKGIERGVDLEVIPYGIAGYSKSYNESESTFDAGADLKWGLTSNLTADFTLNTDFAQVESDELQVNLTRFNLFYPEKRDFFLERADIFAFGSHDAQVFFSRRIGINQGRAVPILGGARLYGLVGDTNVGLLTMQTREAEGLPDENFTVARIKHNILGRSYVGGIITSRMGFDEQRDDTYGLDFEHRFGVNHSVWGMFAKSNREGVKEDNMFFNFGAAYETDLFQGRFVYTDVGPNFNPGIGFVRRHNQRDIFLMGEYRPRPGWKGVRQLLFENIYFRTYNYDGEVETQHFDTSFVCRFHSAEIAGMGVEYSEELVPFSFSISPTVMIPQGQYSFTSVRAGVFSSRNRPFYGSVELESGGFYGGDKTSVWLSAHATFFPQLQMDVNTEIDRVSLPSGRLTSALSRLYLSYYLSSTLITRMAVQYSSLFEEFVFNFRLRWIYAPGSEAWLVYDESRDFDLVGSSFKDRAVIFKIVKNFNF